METWPGGRVRTTKAGKKSYYIYKRINGRLYEVSTRTSTLRAAMVELARFEADPEGYKPGGTLRKEEVRLTSELAEEFLEWSLKVKGNSPRHVYYQRDFLEWWEGHLRRRDLRSLDLRYLEEPLEGTPSRKNKIITIKAFYGWLVGVKRLLEPTEDPTYRRLKVPKPRAAQLQKKKDLSAEEFQAIREKLEAYSNTRNRAGGSPFPAHWLDALDVLGACCHNDAEAQNAGILSQPTSSNRWNGPMRKVMA